MLTITSNNVHREFIYGYELPESVHADYDHLSDDDRADGWIHYRKQWYHMSDFMLNGDNSPFPEKWHGNHGDSFFSGVLIALDDMESYRIATYYS